MVLAVETARGGQSHPGHLRRRRHRRIQLRLRQLRRRTPPVSGAGDRRNRVDARRPARDLEAGHLRPRSDRRLQLDRMGLPRGGGTRLLELRNGDGRHRQTLSRESLAGCGVFDITGAPGADAPSRSGRVGHHPEAGNRRPPAGQGRAAPEQDAVAVDRCAVPSWSWRGHEGLAEIEVYSAEDQVELLLNGRSLGRRACGTEARAT